MLERTAVVLLVLGVAASAAYGALRPRVSAADGTQLMSATLDLDVYCRGLQPGERVQAYTEFTGQGDTYGYYLGASERTANASGLVVFKLALDSIKAGDTAPGTVRVVIYDARDTGYGPPVTLSDGSPAEQTFQVP